MGMPCFLPELKVYLQQLPLFAGAAHGPGILQPRRNIR
jgi:hypothetical protein